MCCYVIQWLAQSEDGTSCKHRAMAPASETPAKRDSATPHTKSGHASPACQYHTVIGSSSPEPTLHKKIIRESLNPGPAHCV